MNLLLDVAPGPVRDDGGLLIVVVAVAFALIFIAAVAAVAIFYFVRSRKHDSRPAFIRQSQPTATAGPPPAGRN